MDRIRSIDGMRVLSIFSIVILHSQPFFVMNKTLAILINQGVRYAVPCFFVLSGYLYAQRCSNGGSGRAFIKITQRTLTLYFFWSLFYLIPYNLSLNSDAAPHANLDYSRFYFHIWISSFENFFLGGAKYHLWFLSALFCAAAFCTPFLAISDGKSGNSAMRWMMLASGILYLFGLAFGAYKDFSVYSIGFNVRNGPFFSALFFATGIVISRSQHLTLTPGVGLLLLVGGSFLHLAEVFFLNYYLGKNNYPDFVIGTYLSGVGAAILGISGCRFLESDVIYKLGRYTLAIYLLHPFLMDFFIPVQKYMTYQTLWQVFSPVIFFVLTLGVAIVFSKVPGLRKMLV